jgi:hypothetical protein
MCGAKSPYRLNNVLHDAPQRCGCYRHRYSTSPPASLRCMRPINKKALIALTRIRLQASCNQGRARSTTKVLSALKTRAGRVAQVNCKSDNQRYLFRC